jgi:hypothetical protein
MPKASRISFLLRLDKYAYLLVSTYLEVEGRSTYLRINGSNQYSTVLSYQHLPLPSNQNISVIAVRALLPVFFILLLLGVLLWTYGFLPVGCSVV